MVGSIDAPREALYRAKLNFTSKGKIGVIEREREREREREKCMGSEERVSAKG